jgi:hypothetical protein
MLRIRLGWVDRTGVSERPFLILPKHSACSPFTLRFPCQPERFVGRRREDDESFAASSTSTVFLETDVLNVTKRTQQVVDGSSSCVGWDVEELNSEFCPETPGVFVFSRILETWTSSMTSKPVTTSIAAIGRSEVATVAVAAKVATRDALLARSGVVSHTSRCQLTR